ncbi:hypothetical protein SEPCBS119000_006444 [Sporothrix epigloea]|uniref:Ubiquitin-like domain-containing protein n=1 Tax=Sporothrix epigloea TaxID=1892477 RepID=A0ABP0E779_9PEZI
METLDAHDEYGHLRVTVRLLSPSRGADLPEFTNLPVHVTIGQLKNRIRNELNIPSRSSLDMRLIYRGRILDIEERTLLDVFGISAIREADTQVLHLVLRTGGADATTHTTTDAVQHTGSVHNPFAPAVEPDSPPAAADNVTMVERERSRSRSPVRRVVEQLPEEMRHTFDDMLRDEALRRQLRHEANPWDQQQYVRRQWREHAVTPCVPREPSYLVDFIDPELPAREQEEAEELAFRQLRHIHFLQQQSLNIEPQLGDLGFLERQKQRLISYQYLEVGQLRHTIQKRRQDRLRLGILPERQQEYLLEEQPEEELEANQPEQPEQPEQPQDQQETQLHSQVPAAMAQVVSESLYYLQNSAVFRQRHVPASHQDAAQQQQHAQMTTSASFDHQPADSPAMYLLESPAEPVAVVVDNNVETNTTSFTQADPATGSLPVSQTPPPNVPREEWYIQTIQRQREHIQQQHQHYQSVIRQHLRDVEMLHGMQHQQQEYNLQQNFQQQAAVQHAAAENAASLHALNAHAMAGAAQQEQVANLHQAELRPNNVGAGALAAMWPYLWLLVRLTIFVWWFTSPSASWTRWTTVILVAIFLFVFNTGILDEAFNQALAPIRAHLDGFVHPDRNGQAAPQTANTTAPAAAEHAPEDLAASTQAAVDPANRAVESEPDPYAAAARLVAERRRNNGRRLMNFARWLERVGIMFIASLAPGIAERHVALAEERDREERRRLQETAEAQAQAEAAAAASAAASSGERKEAGANVEGTSGLQATVEDEELVALEEQWRNEEHRQSERVAAQ